MGERPFDSLVSWLVPPDGSVPAAIPRNNVTEETLWPWDEAETLDFTQSLTATPENTDTADDNDPEEKPYLAPPVPPPDHNAN